MPTTRAGPLISISTPLGADVLVLRSFTGREAISELFNFQLELVSEKPPVNLESIIGQNVTVSVVQNAGSTRYLNGFVS